MFNVCDLRTNWLKILILEDLGWIQVFWKTFRLILMHFFIKQRALRSSCIKMLCFSKIWFFHTFNRSNLLFDQSKLRLKFLVWVCLTQLMFNRFSIDRNWKIFGFYVFDQIVFFMHHLCLGFTCIALFLYPSCSFVVISLIVFTHNMHILCYIGYSTWSKNWFINFWAMYFLVYAFFMCELWKIFFLRNMMDNQYANIFSTHVTVYGSHNAKFAFIERENIFLHVYPQLSFFFFFF